MMDVILRASFFVAIVSCVEPPITDVLQLIKYLPHKELGISQHFKNGEVKFNLFTKNISKPLLGNSDFDYVDPGKPFKLIIHGWTESPSRTYYKDMTDAYLRRGDFNVVQVDWSKPASGDYNSAVRNIVPVGANIGQFVAKLNESQGVRLDDVHLLGHSLGAHVAGMAGKEVTKLTGGKIKRITGLDPAGPLFDIATGATKRLDKNHAEMVDVVHTDGGIFGYEGSIGTVDFFPNGGIGFQPGCSIFQQKDWLKGTFKSAKEYAFCSHTKSHAYYIESINSKKMLATKCKSWTDFQANACVTNEKVIFGEDVPLTSNGNFYFKTPGFIDTKFRKISF